MASFHDAERVLRARFGYPGFRPAQRGVVQSVLARHDVLAVLPTGGGKSVCFQVPALALGGYTVVVCPLISLMQDQVAAAVARGIRARALHAGMTSEARRTVLAELAAGCVDLLYLSPERLSVIAARLRAQAGVPTLLAVDEAHCISEWGHDFRPAYRTLREARRALGEPPAVALTGSATPEVRADIVALLGLGRAGGAGRRVDVHLASFDRPNLWFGAIEVRNERERLERLIALVRHAPAMALVYTPTRGAAERVAAQLRYVGRRAVAYHAGLPRDRRDRLLDAFLRDEVNTVVATCAFGMGIDKPDVRLVVHWRPPATPESYYQEAGRAGRDGGASRALVLWGEKDFVVRRRQLRGRGTEAARAARRLAAVERYVRGRGCRRRALLAYFGETAAGCSGCDACDRGSPLARLVRGAGSWVRAVFGDRKAAAGSH